MYKVYSKIPKAIKRPSCDGDAIPDSGIIFAPIKYPLIASKNGRAINTKHNSRVFISQAH
jgi:hypothetical protein